MIARLVEMSLVQRILLCALGLSLLFGGLYSFHLLDIIAYPDPSPPMVELITQNPGWSAEEIERQITIPIEVALTGMPGLDRCPLTLHFWIERHQSVLRFRHRHLSGSSGSAESAGSVEFPPGVQPELSPWWAIAEIYRYEMTGEPGISLTELKTLQDWQVRRAFRRIPGVIDVTAFGGTTKEYHVDIDPGKLISYGVNLSQVMTALQNSNANVGGNYLTIGAQNYNMRGVGLINGIQDIENVMVAQKEGTPIYVKTLGQVNVGSPGSLGESRHRRSGRRRGRRGAAYSEGTKRCPCSRRSVKRSKSSTNGNCRPGVKIKTFYDRTALIHTTVETVTDIMISGMVLVFPSCSMSFWAICVRPALSP